MTATVEQIAREIAAEMPIPAAYNVFQSREFFRQSCENILRRHLPAGAGVVEEQLNEYQDAAFTLGRIDAQRGIFASTTTEWKEQHAEVKKLHAQLLAAVPAVGRVVPRPVREVSTIKTPRDVCVTGNSLWMESTNGHKSVGGWPYLYDGIARWSVDGITWHSRTTTSEPRAWEASDVPEGRIVLIFGDENTSYTAAVARSGIAKEANGFNATHLIVLPANPEVG